MDGMGVQDVQLDCNEIFSMVHDVIVPFRTAGVSRWCCSLMEGVDLVRMVVLRMSRGGVSYVLLVHFQYRLQI